MSFSTVNEEKLCFIEQFQPVNVERITAEYHNSTTANKITYSNKNH